MNQAKEFVPFSFKPYKLMVKGVKGTIGLQGITSESIYKFAIQILFIRRCI